jgi:SH3 and multiple ankyrin repeat domains protein
MIEAVKRGDTNKVAKFTCSGLDPNFNDRDTGETPLTLASVMSHPVEMVMALVSGGAHLDFRNKKGLTALHTAAQKSNEDALRVSCDFDLTSFPFISPATWSKECRL